MSEDTVRLRKMPEVPAKAIGNNIVVDERVEKMTSGGIVLPGKGATKVLEVITTVVDMGDFETDKFKVGDKVLIKCYGNEALSARKETEEFESNFISIKPEQVLGVY